LSVCFAKVREEGYRADRPDRAEVERLIGAFEVAVRDYHTNDDPLLLDAASNAADAAHDNLLAAIFGPGYSQGCE